MGHASARYFQPQVGGLGTSDGPVFRIDHDQNFQQTTHAQYQPWKRGPWVAFNWRYDSGLVAVPNLLVMLIMNTVFRSGLCSDHRELVGSLSPKAFAALCISDFSLASLPTWT